MGRRPRPQALHREARGCWSRWDAPGKRSGAPAGAPVPPRGPSRREGTPCPAPPLPCLCTSSRQGPPFPSPALARARWEGGGKGVPDPGSGAAFLRPLLQSPSPGTVSPPAPKALWLQVPQPRSITAGGTWLLSPRPLGHVGSAPRPHALPPHRISSATALPSSTFGGTLGSEPVPTSPCVARVHPLLFSWFRDHCSVPAQVLGCSLHLPLSRGAGPWLAAGLGAGPVLVVIS